MKETTARPESAGAPPPADAAVSPATDPTIADRRAARLSRVGDYQTRTLAQEDALLANLGSINSGLMCVALWLDETIKQALESGPRSVERLRRILPAIDTHLRVSRQVERFAGLELRAAASRRANQAPPAGVRQDASSAVEPKQSEEPLRSEELAS